MRIYLLYSIRAVGFVILCMMVACGRKEPPSEGGTKRVNVAEPSGPFVTCPVCGLTFPQNEAAGSVEVNGKKYYFYLEDHLKAFKANPNTYLESRSGDADRSGDTERPGLNRTETQ
jgi:YHS domain-containing protein